jgi:cytochrome bd ubiquinol oxidase subunit II
VGMLHSFVGKDDVERRIAVNSIGPIWDGNEMWLVVAAAAIFAAFPSWYATMFSSLYLVMVIILLALIGRGVSFEYTRKIDNQRWRSAWKWSLTIGSALIPFLLGTALGDLLHGLPINSSHNYTGSFWGLLVPFGLYTGLTVTVLSLFVGAAYLTLKTEGALHDRVARLSGLLGWLAVVITFGWLTWLHVGISSGFFPEPIEVLALVAVIGGALLADSRSEGWAFAAAATAIGSVVASIFFELFPRVMVSSTNSAYNLTVANSASNSYSLKVMTVVAVIFFPLILLYQGWSLYIFRKRIGGGPPSKGAAPVEPDVPPTDPEEPRRAAAVE